MTFGTEYVTIASINGDAIVPADQAVGIAKEEAKDTGHDVTIRDEFTDELFATVKPNGKVEEARLMPTHA